MQYQDITAHVSPQELTAASFLKENYSNSNVLLVSDPATQNILEAISLVNTQGGAYMDKETRNQLDLISNTTSVSEIAQELYRINDKVAPTNGKRLLVLSGRSFIWLQSSKKNKDDLSFNIWNPSDLTFENKKQIQRFADDPHFSLVFENSTLAIFEVSP